MRKANSTRPDMEIKTAKQNFPNVGTCLKVLTKGTAT